MERLWRSLKYEDVYLRDYADCLEAKRHRLLDHILRQPSPHQALHADGGPRDGITGALSNTAADMMDNARALPTCPQPQQQPQTALIAA